MKYLIIILLFVIIAFAIAKNVLRTECFMDKDLPHVIIPRENRSELQTFASWFHQDWELVFPDFYTGAKMYINSLPSERRKVLKLELKVFLDKHCDSDQSDIINSWVELGAQAWEPGLDIYETLSDFISVIEKFDTH